MTGNHLLPFSHVWLAYSLPVAVPNRLDIRSSFNLGPLIWALKKVDRWRELLAETA